MDDAQARETLAAADELADAVCEAHLYLPDYDFSRIMRALGHYRALRPGRKERAR